MSENGERQKICPISTLSEAGQMICCSSKKVDHTMLLSHFLANQIARKPVRINCHIIMCWYEWTVQGCGSSNCMVELSSSWSSGVLCLCFQAQSPLPEKPGSYLLLSGEASLKRPELPPPPPRKKVIGKRNKNGVSLMRRLFSRTDGVFSFEEEMFPSPRGYGTEKISSSYMCIGFFIIIVCNPPPPLKNLNKTLEKIPFQARTNFWCKRIDL